MSTSVDSWQVTTVEELEEIIGTPSDYVALKSTPWVTPLVRQFVMSSPYFLMGTANSEGTCDVTPRGDPPGSLLFLDDSTLVIPERPGNRRVDSMRNIVSNPHVGLLFLIPGTDETVRINGRATISRQPELRSQLAMKGKEPLVVIVIEIEEVFTHCARSILRSKLWDSESWPDTDTIPTLAAMIAEQTNSTPPDESNGKRNEEYRTRLY